MTSALGTMKKDVVMTLRVDDRTGQLIRKLAREDDRSTAWMLRKLMEEALQARGVLPKRKR